MSLFYFTSYVLNMFRTLIYPSSGACDYSVELPHWSYCLGLLFFNYAKKIYVKVLYVISYKHTKTCKTQERQDNRTEGFLRIIHRTPIVGTEKEHILPQHYEII